MEPGGKTGCYVKLQTGCFLAELQSWALRRQVELQQWYLQKLLKNCT